MALTKQYAIRDLESSTAAQDIDANFDAAFGHLRTLSDTIAEVAANIPEAIQGETGQPGPQGRSGRDGRHGQPPIIGQLPVPVNQGGTGIQSYTTGDILYASNSGTISKLAGVATGQVIASQGTSTAPAWSGSTFRLGSNSNDGSIEIALDQSNTHAIWRRHGGGATSFMETIANGTGAIFPNGVVWGSVASGIARDTFLRRTATSTLTLSSVADSTGAANLIVNGYINAGANVILNAGYLSGDGGNEGIQVGATGAVTTSSDLTIGASGGNVVWNTYTPTITNGTNVAASTAQVTMYMRVGTHVIVNGSVSIDPTAAGATDFDISLPVASNLGATTDASGVLTSLSEFGTISGDTVNDRVDVAFTAVDTANHLMFFQFQYRII